MRMPENSITAAIDAEIDTLQMVRLLLSRIDGAERKQARLPGNLDGDGI
jgi:hypothetical protein